MFIIGLGKLGKCLAKQALASGVQVSALVRHVSECIGVTMILGDLDYPETLVGLPLKNRELYYFAPPPNGGVCDTRMRHWLVSLVSDNFPEKIVYISTTGVYGDCQGRWVNEEVSPKPGTDRSRRRLDAENMLRQWGVKNRVPVVVLRVSGIYGVNRLPVESLRKGRPVVRSEEAPFSNRIHEDDLLQVCLVAMKYGRTGAIYNVSDGQQTTMTDYFFAVADALGLPRPPEVSHCDAESQFSPAMRSYLQESRRIDNRKMIHELKIILRYPDLVHGLACFD
ncbi:MAG: SDR family oxidoreductase [Gammaproteobacteria bacterium]|nr:SDR family oxidoreductase [Gammaproteobacteria bacterium]